jgi:methylated-DNA-[protein]-cysteine S-methyltransferase
VPCAAHGAAYEERRTIEIGDVSSPIGTVFVAVRGGRLSALAFEEAWARKRAALERRFGAADFRRAKDPGGIVGMLRRYFDGDVDSLEEIPVDPGGTPFQRAVWFKLRQVPAGRTVSYGELARAAGFPRAVRAVGAANGSNPVGLVIPCHRVIGSNGKLVGYGGGLDRKGWLLSHEGAELGPS